MTLNRASCAATLEAIAEGSAATHERQGHRGHRKALLLLISRRSPALSYGTFALAARRNALFVVIIATASPLALASDTLAHHVRLRKAAFACTNLGVGTRGRGRRHVRPRISKKEAIKWPGARAGERSFAAE